MDFILKTDNSSNKQRICNAINCYYSNEHMNECDYESSVLNISECKYCAYNYNRLYEIKTLINNELKRFSTKIKTNNKLKFHDVLFICAMCLIIFLILLYSVIHTKFFII